MYVALHFLRPLLSNPTARLFHHVLFWRMARLGMPWYPAARPQQCVNSGSTCVYMHTHARVLDCGKVGRLQRCRMFWTIWDTSSVPGRLVALERPGWSGGFFLEGHFDSLEYYRCGVYKVYIWHDEGGFIPLQKRQLKCHVP